MNPITNDIKKTIMLIGAFTLLLSCERDTEGLPTPKFSNDPNVFIDGFSGGLNYAAFGNSVPTAFDVDFNETYDNSPASMRFEVPELNDPRGTYAGGTYFTSVGRDLSSYNVLTFWAKASQPAAIDVIGFGNDLGANRYTTTINGLPINSYWQKYYIPLPDPALLTEEKGLFFYSEGAENDRGYTFWIDELKYENLGSVAQLGSAIMGGEDATVDSENGETVQITGLTASINLPNGLDQSVNTSPYFFTFTSSDESVATVNPQGEVQILGEGTAKITASVAGKTSKGSLTINAGNALPKPTTPAPAPTQMASDVISLYSNNYVNVPVDTWNTRWMFSTAEETFLQVQGDDIIRYKNLNFVGIEFVSQTIDATNMTHFHIDIWTPDPTDLPASFKVLLVDFGANNTFGGGDDSSHELSFTRPRINTGQWISLDIPLNNFSGLTRRQNLAQLVLSGDLPNLYIDNVYFYTSGGGQGGSPTGPPPVPTSPASDVISIYSDSYSNVAGTNLNPNWGQATTVSEINFNGNKILKYGGLNYQGTQLGSNQNVTSMNFLHVDYWSANSSNLNIFIISPGPVETAYALNVPTGGWQSIDIPLSAFQPVNLSNVFQFKFDGNGDIFIDNLYFKK